MKTVCDKNMCAGCMACVDVCPKNAITVRDSLEFYNAVVDVNKCIDCNACTRVCQQLNHSNLLKPIKWFQGWATEDSVRCNGSSGGVAYAIEKMFVREGGLVASCYFDKGIFGFKCTQNEDELIDFVGSKYVKSNPEGIYKKISIELKQGKKVLFVGLPCQVAAVKKFIKESDQAGLYTIDLICHGTPSPSVLNIYLKQYGASLSSVVKMKFRTKQNFQVVSDYIPAEGEFGICDHYSTAFLNCVCYTENCYSCAYARTERIGDITLGDSWGSSLSAAETNKGVSLILCQTAKGEQLLREAGIHLEDVDLDNAVAHNHQLQEPSKAPDFRPFFFKSIKGGKNFNSIILRCYPWICFKQRIKKSLIKMKLYKSGGGVLRKLFCEKKQRS